MFQINFYELYGVLLYMFVDVQTLQMITVGLLKVNGCVHFRDRVSFNQSPKSLCKTKLTQIIVIVFNL